ncbi:hypothetical protein PHISP_02348 [Aspergillus sp. HF37]|nr:hypothetical protein PHISP_02348 [Aspergillus sp. HF37]
MRSSRNLHVANFLTFRICGPTDVYHMDQSIGMAQVVQKLITQTSSLVRPGDKTSNVEKLNRNRSPSFNTATIIRFASV